MKNLVSKLKNWRFKKSPVEEDIPPAGFVSTEQEGAGSTWSRVLLQTLLQALEWIQFKVQPYLAKVDFKNILIYVIIVTVSYLLALNLSSFLAYKSLSVLTSFKGNSLAGSALNGVFKESAQAMGLSEVKKNVLARNIFNSEGVLAPEASAGDNKLIKTADLDLTNVACVTDKIPVEIQGTIFTGNPKTSLVIMKDAKIPDADVYKSGDVIIDNEDYEIFSVLRGEVQIRHGDRKICVSLKGVAPDKPETAGGAGPSGVKPENSERIEFDSNYINQAIGPGYVEILNAAKMIPEVDPSNKVLGFKLIGIVPGSIFDKMKLVNGDLITDVNGASMKDPTQGFKLYQSMQEEREINISFTRNGEQMTRNIRVK